MNSKLAAVGAFLSGGVLVAAVTLGMSAAHGAGTTASSSTGQPDAQYTAKHTHHPRLAQSGLPRTIAATAFGDPLRRPHNPCKGVARSIQPRSCTTTICKPSTNMRPPLRCTHLTPREGAKINEEDPPPDRHAGRWVGHRLDATSSTGHQLRTLSGSTSPTRSSAQSSGSPGRHVRPGLVRTPCRCPVR